MANKHKQASGDSSNSWRDTSVFFGGPGRRWTLWISWIVIIVVVGVSCAILFWPKHDDTSSQPATGAKPSGSAVAAERCPASTWDEAAIMPPKDLRWTSVSGNRWPTSKTAGPTATIDGLHRCFARSPAGAALAAVNLTQSLRTAGQDLAHRILDAQYVQNAGKDISAAAVDELYPTQPPSSRKLGEVVGYTFIGYSTSLTRVLLVEKWEHRTQFTGFTVTLEWLDGDWHVLLDSSGQPSPDGEISVDPEAFTYWEVPA
ncbi:hypothetical protein [Plantibacter sp. RU18]|uniref:hypothetical protein n=1 Tax=Plantibacter sp. RU18 TaxID=3158143 RepID=UPI003D36A93D